MARQKKPFDPDNIDPDMDLRTLAREAFKLGLRVTPPRLVAPPLMRMRYRLKAVEGRYEVDGPVDIQWNPPPSDVP